LTIVASLLDLASLFAEQKKAGAAAGFVFCFNPPIL